MQWAVDLVCKPIFNPAFMQVVSTAINRQPGRQCVSLHKPLASSDESSYLFHPTCSVNLHITVAHASRLALPIIVVTGANKYVVSLDHTVSRALHSPTSLYAAALASVSVAISSTASCTTAQMTIVRCFHAQARTTRVSITPAQA